VTLPIIGGLHTHHTARTSTTRLTHDVVPTLVRPVSAVDRSQTGSLTHWVDELLGCSCVAPEWLLHGSWVLLLGAYLV
jgi:hypothetical protein